MHLNTYFICVSSIFPNCLCIDSDNQVENAYLYKSHYVLFAKQKYIGNIYLEACSYKSATPHELRVIYAFAFNCCYLSMRISALLEQKQNWFKQYFKINLKLQ